MTRHISKTELLYKKSKPIDHLSVGKGITLMVNEQKDAAKAVKNVTNSIELAINQIHKHLMLNNEGRLIYAGAGTSARIGVQDGVELFPTFNWPNSRLDYIIAGGNDAILNAVENAEDDVMAAKDAVTKKMINLNDVVIGLAASGNTRFTCKVLEEAYKKGALTIAISNNPDGHILKFGHATIILDTQEEVILGSTRLKAGTAQKICLNIISSMVMIKMGRVQNGVMSHMVPTNEKLRHRKLRIKKQL
ncbi:N-acetylmuramic acid 6-phosphate etherase [Alphaproteobacteria bacterium]|nr:N-acetylmuramic acid 6-phosphate etherase [Alphaproteobacteria bacterium]